jgi:RimJ/RimL family protein N-acetyltransferase
MSDKRSAHPEVRLRGVIDSDLPALFEQQRDPEAVRMAAFPSRAWEPFLAHWEKIRANEATLLRTVVYDGQVAGHVLSFERDGVREVGYWLGRQFWGLGIATRALALFLQEESLRPLYAHVAKHNLGSRRVLEKNGFTLEGDEKDFAVVDDQPVEGWILKLER